MTRARTDIADIERQITQAMATCRMGAPQAPEWDTIETFVALALRVLAKTNPSRVRDAALALEIGMRIKNRPQGAGEKSS